MQRVFKHLKVYILKDEIVRFEYSPNDNFTTESTLFIESKKISFEEANFTCSDSTKFEYNGYEFSFNEDDPLNSLVVTKNNVVVYKYKDIKNSGELPLPNKTPIIFPLMDSPRIIIPASGYVVNNEGFNAEEDVKDLYLLLCNKDYLKLRKQYISLTGKNYLPRLKSFGLFSSRYYKYSQKTAMEMIEKYEKKNIPLDTFVLDTDWRDMEQLAGCGYTINKKLFPHLEEFFRFAHKHNVQVMMNDHPLPLNKESKVFDKDEIEYRNKNLTKFYNIGLDGWWYDRNWASKLNSVSREISSETLGNYLFSDITKQFHLGFTLDQEVYERDLVMSNINNVVQGEYKSILDSASHRYSLQWSGDILSDEQSLRNEIVNLNKCANNMVAHYSSDIGGHQGDPTKNQYIRWMEYGAFSPVLRPHCSCGVKKFREPWNYDQKTLEITRNYINMRYSLLNVFYTASYKNTYEGLGVCSPLYLYYPEDKKAYKEDASYLINGNILVAPISGSDKPYSLTKKEFKKGLRLTIYPNNEFKGPISFSKSVKSFEDINKFYASVKAKFPKIKEFSLRFKGLLNLHHDYTLGIKNDVKSRVFLNNKVVFDDFNDHYESFNEVAKIKRSKTYKLELEALMPRKQKMLNLIYYKINKANTKVKVYLPEGEWYNIFHRNLYQGKRYVKERFKIDETPVFVKAGTVLPLYKKISNISKMSLKTLVYDYYTSKKAVTNDFFYEDDGISTAYNIGEYRKNEYKTYFKDGSYFVEFKGSNKLLDDDIKIRDVYFKAHIQDNETIDRVLVNGEPIKFRRHNHLRKAIPFLDYKFARDSKTLTFKFRQVIKNDYKIELVLRKD